MKAKTKSALEPIKSAFKAVYFQIQSYLWPITFMAPARFQSLRREWWKWEWCCFCSLEYVWHSLYCFHFTLPAQPLDNIFPPVLNSLWKKKSRLLAVQIFYSFFPSSVVMEVMRAISAPGPLSNLQPPPCTMHHAPCSMQPATVDKCIPSGWKSRWRVGGGAGSPMAVAVALTPFAASLVYFAFFFLGQRLQYFCVFICLWPRHLNTGAAREMLPSSVEHFSVKYCSVKSIDYTIIYFGEHRSWMESGWLGACVRWSICFYLMWKCRNTDLCHLKCESLPICTLKFVLTN